MKRSRILWLLLLIVIIAVGMRSWQLTARSLWFDEAFSWRLIQFPLTELIARDAADVHPPLYYIILQWWSVVFGSSLLALRNFSVGMAGLTVAAGYLFTASATRSRAVGLFAATLLAVAGFQIQFAWEARMYTLGTLLLLVSSWLLLKAVRASSSTKPSSLALLWWLAYGVLAAAFAYIHYFAFFSLAAHALFVLGYILVETKGRPGEILQWRFTWYALLAAGVASLLYLPWLPTFIAQNAQVQNSFWIPAIGGWSIPDTFYRMFAPTSGIPRHIGLGWILLAVTPIALTLLGWLSLAVGSGRREPKTRDADWLIVLSGLVPFLLVIVLSFIGQSLYQDRFLVFAHIFIIIGLAVLLSHLPWRRFRRVAYAAALLGLIVTSVDFWFELDIPNKPGAQAATTVALEQRGADDPVIVSSPFVYFAVLHYAQEDYGGVVHPQLFSETELGHFAGGPILLPEDIVGRDIFNTDATALWVIDTSGFGGEKLAVPAPWRAEFSQTYPEVFTHQGDVFVTKYVR